MIVEEVRMNKQKSHLIAFCIVFFVVFSSAAILGNQQEQTDEQKILEVVHSISSHTLFDYVKELALDKYGGRLTGTQEYLDSAEWVISHFKNWGISPGGDDNSYLQAFPNPYTLVFEDCEVSLHIPFDKDTVKKFYVYEDDFIPGSTSGSGQVTAEVVYVGYGITSPELGYDDYQGVNVVGKIVLMEREAPVSPDKDPELFKKWWPYSFHQYKLENAVAHGAKGMLYNYGPIANPNNSYDASFIYSHVGSTVVADVFSGTGKDHTQVVETIEKTLKPQSFDTGKIFTIRNTTEHHPDGIAQNVIGLLEGSDPELKEELIIIGGHLDHVGRCYEVMPGANDNASAVAVILGLAEALTKSPVKPKRTIMFNCFGAEEQAVAGSQYYVDNPLFPLEKTIGFINMDGVGCGDKLSALAAKNYSKFWAFLDKANAKYVHREIRPIFFANNARPRLDAARFMWEGVPSITFSAYGAPTFYHITKDDITTITPEILEDLTQILYLAVLDMANQDDLNFRE